MSELHITRIPVLESRVLAAVAHELTLRQKKDLPDLSGAVVLLPHLHAAESVARALHAQAGFPTLLLPKLTTLKEWAGQVILPIPVGNRAAREAALYDALAKRDWLKGVDLWAVAGELVGLIDELTRWRVLLPVSLADFTQKLQNAYCAKPGATLNFEARLIYELWHALAVNAEEMDEQMAYHLALNHLAQTSFAPLYAVGLARLSPAEEEFFKRYAKRATVCFFDVDVGRWQEPRAQTLSLAWPKDAGEDLRGRSASLCAQVAQSALHGSLRIVDGMSEEEEARVVDVTVRRWLSQGKKNIAVVVQDHVVARRARALLERAQVLVKDEAGWAFSTTSAATVIGRFLDVASNNCYHKDLLDLLKSPFAFHDVALDVRKHAVWRLEQWVRGRSVVAGLDNFIRLAVGAGDKEAETLLKRVGSAQALLGRGKKSLAGWLQALLKGLAQIGIEAGLEADAAGDTLLELLESLMLQLEGDKTTVTFSEWRGWLSRRLEAATFRDPAIESPVVFTHLSTTFLRSFDAALIVGVDAAHLPGPDPASLFFNQGVRAELGLPTFAQSAREMEEHLSALIASCPEVVATWQAAKGVEENLLSPFFERLDTLHKLAYKTSLRQSASQSQLQHCRAHVADAPGVMATTRPQPPAPAHLIPAQISASGYNSLMTCPYQFYARHLLKLGEEAEVQELIEKRDYGLLVHDVLKRFHGAHPLVSQLNTDEALGELTAFSEHAFAEAIRNNYLASAWLARWKVLIPDYLAWQRAREAQGWRWKAAEEDRHIEIDTPGGRKLILRGRIDRVDEDGQARIAVLDYKTQRKDILRKKLREPGEDVQLPVYALLWGGPVAEALFLSIEREGVGEIRPRYDLEEVAQSSRERLGLMYDALHEQAPLPAQGAEEDCQYCEAQGLCRRQHWP